MNNKDLIKQLNSLKNIEPDRGFVFSARKIILVEKSVSERMPSWVWGFGFALLIFAIMGSGFLFPSEPQISLLDSEILKEELRGISLSLEEIEYRQEIDTTIVSALSEISTSQAKHLNLRILELEQELIKGLNGENSEIEEMLDSIIF